MKTTLVTKDPVDLAPYFELQNRRDQLALEFAKGLFTSLYVNPQNRAEWNREDIIAEGYRMADAYLFIESRPDLQK
jgi:hypothetical protein